MVPRIEDLAERLRSSQHHRAGIHQSNGKIPEIRKEHQVVHAPAPIRVLGHPGRWIFQTLFDPIQIEPTPQQSHLGTDLGGGLRLRWEQHGEFHTCTFWKQLAEIPAGFDAMPHADVPDAWLQAQPGEWLVGLQVLVKPVVSPRHSIPIASQRTKPFSST